MITIKEKFKIILHAFLFILLLLTSIYYIYFNNIVAAILGIMSTICWLVLLIFYDIMPIIKRSKQNASNLKDYDIDKELNDE